MEKRTRLLAVMLTIVLLLSTAAIAESAESVVAMAITNAWASWCPYFDSGNYTDVISDQLYDRLWITHMDGTVEPRLADSYEMAEDHSGMTIHLNQNAKFHDGEPVTADDVIYTALLDTDPEFNSVKRDQMKFIMGTSTGGVRVDDENFGFEKVDDYTVKVTFKEPMNELSFIAMSNRYIYILPEHIYGQYTPAELNDASIWKEHMIGSGPFKFDSAVDGERVELVANKDYFLGAPEFDRLVIRVVVGSQLLTGLMSREIDVIAGAGIASIPLSDWAVTQGEGYLTTESVPNFAYQSMIINTTSDKIPNAECRNAISKAINRQAIVDYLLEGEGVVLYAPFGDSHPFVDTSKLDLPVYNPEEAKKQLEDNGFDFSQTLELIVPVGNEVRIQSTVLIQQNLEAIGVKTNITQYDFPTLMQMMRDGQFDLGMIGSAGGIDPTEPLGWLNNAGTTNFPCVQDSTYYDMFTATNSILDLEERKAAFVDIWQYIIDDAAVVYLYSSNFLTAYNHEKLTGVDFETAAQLNWCANTWKLS